ncbi:ATP-binding protein [Bacillus cereus]|nr:ATP-binding protein [Bacillus cereus]MEC3259793.1 ATP-binding protein [Bacillus cereus]
MASKNKFEKELEKAVLKVLIKHWRFFLLLSGILFVWITRYEILNRLIQIVPIVKRVVHVSLLLLFIGTIFWITRCIVLYRLEKKSYKYVLVIPHMSDDAKVDQLGDMIRQVHGEGRKPLEQLWKGRDWYRLLMYQPEDIDGKSQKVRFYLGGPEENLAYLVKAFRNVYKNAEIIEQNIEDIPFPRNKLFGGAVGGRMKLKTKKSLSLAQYKTDKLPQLISGMEEKTWIDVSFSPDRDYRLTRRIKKEEAELKARKRMEKDLDVFQKTEAKVLTQRFLGKETAFQVCVSVATEVYPGVRMLKGLGNIIASMMADVNELRYRSFRRSIWRIPIPYYGRMTWTGSELVNLLHLPNIKGDKEDEFENKILYLESGEKMLPEGVLSTGLTIGTLVHPLERDREVKMTEEQFKKMGCITGGTGAGKSTVAGNVLDSALNLWIENPSTASGFSLFDPTPDLAIVVLNRLLKAELEGAKVDWDKVHFIRFRKTKYPPAINLLHRNPDEDTQTVVDSIFESIQALVPNPAPQTERILKAIIGTLLCDGSQEHSTLSIIAFGTDELFRERVLDGLEGPESMHYRNLWKNEIGAALEDSMQPLLNRLDIFRSSTYLKRIYGQSDFSLDILKWMDEGHLVFYDLSGMGNADIKLTIGYIMNQYHRTVQKRQIGSKLHLAFIDEAHKVPVPILPKIVAEDRKYGLGLWIITQQISGQLDQKLADALTEIGGNFFVCRQGKSSAKALEGIMQGKFRAEYLQGLPDLEAAVQTQDKFDGKAKNVWCMIKAPPLDRYRPNGKVATYGNDKEIADSNEWTFKKINELEKRGKSAEEIDREINLFLYGQDITAPTKVNLKKEDESLFEKAEKEAAQEGSLFEKAEKEAAQEGSLFEKAEEAAQEESLFEKAEEAAQEESPFEKAEEAAQEESLFEKAEEAAQEESLFEKAEETAQEESLFEKAEEVAQEESPFEKAEEAAQEESLFEKAEETEQEESPVIMDMPFPWEMENTDHIFLKEKGEIDYPFETGDDDKEKYPVETKKEESQKVENAEPKVEKSIFDF